MHIVNEVIQISRSRFVLDQLAERIVYPVKRCLSVWLTVCLCVNQGGAVITPTQTDLWSSSLPGHSSGIYPSNKFPHQRIPSPHKPMVVCIERRSIATKSLTAAMSKLFIRMPVATCSSCYNLEVNARELVCSWWCIALVYSLEYLNNDTRVL